MAAFGFGTKFEFPRYKGEPGPRGFRANILADDTVIPEIKDVATLLPAHDLRLQTYLRMSGQPADRSLNLNMLWLEA